MAITIQLNGDALNKLIDLSGGEEFVLQLRQGVIENVLSRRIKAIASETILKAQESIAVDIVSKQVGKLEKDGYGNVRKISIEPKLLEELSRQGHAAVDVAIRDAKAKIEEVAKAAAEEFAQSFEKRIETSVNTKMERWTSAYIDQLVQAKLKSALSL